jgi:hypothetical protein
MATGTLIAESLRVGAVLDGPGFAVTEIRRDDAAGRAAAEAFARDRGVPDAQIDWP